MLISLSGGILVEDSRVKGEIPRIEAAESRLVTKSRNEVDLKVDSCIFYWNLLM